MKFDFLFQFYLRIYSGNRLWVRLVDFRSGILCVTRVAFAKKFNEKNEDDEDKCSNKGKNEFYKRSVLLSLSFMSF